MGWVIDLDGVMWLADEPIAGSADAVKRLQSEGHSVIFVTNNSSARLQDVEAKLAAHGVNAAGAVITSAIAAVSQIEPGERVMVCGGAGLSEEVEMRGGVIESQGPVDVVVVGLTTDFSYELLTRASQAIRGGARFLATNGDVTFPSPHGLLPGAGSLVAAVATASGVSPVIAGKPHEPMVDLVKQRLGSNGVVVGDVPATDGQFAIALGYRFALVFSGVTTPADLPVQPPPDEVADNLAGLVAKDLQKIPRSY